MLQQKSDSDKVKRLKCGEVVIWNYDTYMCAVECTLCDDRPSCNLEDFFEHILVWHQDWNDDDFRKCKVEENANEVKCEISTLSEANIQPFEEVLIETESNVEAEFTVSNEELCSDDSCKPEDFQEEHEKKFKKGLKINELKTITDETKTRNLSIDAIRSSSNLDPSYLTFEDGFKKWCFNQSLNQSKEFSREHSVDSGVDKSELSNDAASSPQSMSDENESFELSELNIKEQILFGLDEPPPKRKLTTADIEKMIELYRAHPRLWQQSHNEHNNSQLCRQSWREITHEWNKRYQFNLTEQDIRLRLSTLRQRYLKERKRREMYTEDENFNAIKYIAPCGGFRYFDNLKFLDGQSESPYTARAARISQEYTKLIEIYARFPMLWNKNYETPMSLEMRAKAYNAICTDLKLMGMHIPLETVRLRLATLKKRYRSEKIKFLQCRLKGKTFVPHFKHYEEMKYLDSYIAPFVCAVCGKIFRLFNEYHGHKVTENHDDTEKAENLDNAKNKGDENLLLEKDSLNVQIEEVQKNSRNRESPQVINDKFNDTQTEIKDAQSKEESFESLNAKYEKEALNFKENESSQIEVMPTPPLTSYVNEQQLLVPLHWADESLTDIPIYIMDSTNLSQYPILKPLVSTNANDENDMIPDKIYTDLVNAVIEQPLPKNLIEQQIEIVDNITKLNSNIVVTENHHEAPAVITENLVLDTSQNNHLTIPTETFTIEKEYIFSEQSANPFNWLSSCNIQETIYTSNTSIEISKPQADNNQLNPTELQPIILPPEAIPVETEVSICNSNTNDVVNDVLENIVEEKESQLMSINVNLLLELNPNLPKENNTINNVIENIVQENKTQVLNTNASISSEINAKLPNENNTINFGLQNIIQEEQSQLIKTNVNVPLELNAKPPNGSSTDLKNSDRVLLENPKGNEGIVSSSSNSSSKKKELIEITELRIIKPKNKMTAKNIDEHFNETVSKNTRSSKAIVANVESNVQSKPDTSLKLKETKRKPNTLMRFTEPQTLKLIELYRLHPLLWNPEHTNYESRRHKRITWRTVATEFNATFHLNYNFLQVQRKIKDYVKYYRREQKRINIKRNGTKWPFCEKLKFLDEVNLNASTLEKRLQHRAQTMKIIEVYKEHPELWDTEHELYTKRNQRQRSVASMCARLQEKYNITIAYGKLKQCLLDLRYNYRATKLAKTEAEKCKDVFEPTSQFEFYEALQFLEPHVPPFNCEQCKIEFKCFSEYCAHLKKQHKRYIRPRRPVTAYDIDKNTLENICHICGIKFTQRQNLVQHLKRHFCERSLSCSSCQKKFFTKSALNEHERIHTKIPAVICPECGRTFVNSSKLNQHQKRHRNQRDFPCEHCDKAFYTAFDRERHVRRHLNIRDKICPVCGKSFVVGSSYYAHIKLHNKVKQYKCAACKLDFAQYAGLYKHRKRHHPDS